MSTLVRFVCGCGAERQHTCLLDPPAPAVTIPTETFDLLVKVAIHVSLGRSAAFTQGHPYPDAAARRALGALHETGHLADFNARHPEPTERGNRP